MPLAARLVLGLQAFLASAVLVGLGVRGRLRHSVSFGAYMVTIVFGVLVAFWPDFYGWRQWLLWQTVQVALKLGILFELGTHIFGPFPGALATMRGAVVLLLSTTVVALLTLQVGGHNLWDFGLRAVPVTSQGVAWGYALLLALAIWFMVPLDSWRKAILAGMAVYMMAFTVVLEMIVARGWGMREAVSNLNMGAYVLLLVYWNWAAWRPASGDDADVDRIRREIPLRLAARAPRP